MSNSPFYLPGMTAGVMGSLTGPLLSPEAISKIRRQSTIQRAALQSAINAGQVDSSNIQNFGYSKYGDIAAKGFEKAQGDVRYDKTLDRSYANVSAENPLGDMVVAEGQVLGKASSDSERIRRRNMINLNEREEVTNVPPAYSSLNNIFNPQAQTAIGGMFGSLFARQNAVNAPMMFKINK